MDEVERSRSRACRMATDMMEIENLIRYAPLAVGLMGIENIFRYPALAVGLKPSASQGEARLRGLYQIIYSKTISPRLSMAKPACASRERQRRPSRLSPLASRLSIAKPACTGEKRGRDTLASLRGQVFWGSPCVPSPVSSHQNARLPLLPLWEKGVGGMRGKGARECRKRDAHRSSAPGTSQNDQGLTWQECFLPIRLWHNTASDRNRPT